MDGAEPAVAGQYTIPCVLVLALDTTTRGGSVAVLRDDVVLALTKGDGSRTHGERLPGEIEATLARAGIAAREVDLLAVASGPGAFTGLRIGLATIQGLAMVIGKPVVGVSALEALADAVWHDDPSIARIVTWMDAQRGEVFAEAHWRVNTSGAIDHSSAMVATPSTALAAVPFSTDEDVVFAGDGAVRYRDVIARQGGPGARLLDAAPTLAPAVARRGRRLAEAGAAGPPHALQPLYVRRPDAELDRERNTER